MRGFGVLILTYGRAGRVKTDKALRKHGYTGPVKYLVSVEDDHLPAYRELYGEDVLTFDKKDYRGRFDLMDNFDGLRSIVFARNASYDAAESLGWDVFVQMDDDYEQFRWRLDADNVPFSCTCYIRSLDAAFEALQEFYRSAPVGVLAVVQGGDYVARSPCGWVTGKQRKAMNVLFCSPSRRVWFRGRLNEDVNAYLGEGSKGAVFLSVPNIEVGQTATQTTPGGLTELYKERGTFFKSFYSVMLRPSCVRIMPMGDHPRLHHRCSWRHAVPKILGPEYAKCRSER